MQNKKCLECGVETDSLFCSDECSYANACHESACHEPIEQRE